MQSDQLKNERYLDWIKTSLSLKYLKDGLEVFSEEKAEELHTDVINKLVINKLLNKLNVEDKCTQCTHETVRKKNFICPDGICHIWLQKILPHHINRQKVCWANSDPRAWQSDPWAIAKLFQPSGYDDKTKAKDTDCVGLLSMMDNCLFFHKFLVHTPLLNLIKNYVRNPCFHSADLEVSYGDMRMGLNLMIYLLEEPELSNRPECREAKNKIEKLRDNDISLCKELELQAISNQVVACKQDIKTLSAQYADLEFTLSQQHDDNKEEIRDINAQMQTVKQEMTEMQHIGGKHRKHMNWVRTSISLYYLKEGLSTFIDEKSRELHSDIKNKVLIRGPWAITSKCTHCTHINVRRKAFCQDNICNVWLEEILPYHVCELRITWTNSNPRAWPSDHWSVAKLFQPRGCVDHMKAEDSDCVSLLSMMMNCRFFHTILLKPELLQEIIRVRNECMHSADMEISHTNMARGLDLMISLLEEPELIIRPECIEAKKKIEQLRDNTLDLSFKSEIEIKFLKNEITGVQHDMNKLAAKQEALQSSLADLTSQCNRNQSIHSKLAIMEARLDTLEATKREEEQHRRDDNIARCSPRPQVWQPCTIM